MPCFALLFSLFRGSNSNCTEGLVTHLQQRSDCLSPASIHAPLDEDRCELPPDHLAVAEELGGEALRHGAIIASIFRMRQILIRQLDDSVVRKLRAKAAAEGVSAEEEARRITR